MKGVLLLNENLVNFFEIIKNGKYGINSMIEFFTELSHAAFANEHIVALNAWFTEILTPVLQYVPFVFLALWAVVWLFGKRLIGFFRFLAFFLTGLVLGTYYLSSPVGNYFPEVPGIAVGVAVGLALGALGVVLYYALYTVVAGYGTYLLCISGMILPEIKGNYLVALIVAIVVLVLLLVIHGFVERFGLSFLGAYFMLYIVVHCIYDFTAPVLGFLPIPAGFEWTVLLASALVLALPGYVLQYKMKKQKY